MKKNIYSLAIGLSMLLISCQQEEVITPENLISEDILSSLVNAGYDVTNQTPIKVNNGYLIEGDIFMSEAQILDLKEGIRIPVEEQYSTNNLVATGGSRTITVYIPQGSSGLLGGLLGGSGFSPSYVAALDEAIDRYNNEGLELNFQRISSVNADIVFTRLGFIEEQVGVLGSAGFPTANGDPYHEIMMSGVLESKYGADVDGMATIMAHEMGHCIGFRHTDYFDRSISCGGVAQDEGEADVGSNHVPGTPTGADLEGNGSWMLACSDLSSRPFTSSDQTALDYLY